MLSNGIIEILFKGKHNEDESPSIYNISRGGSTLIFKEDISYDMKPVVILKNFLMNEIMNNYARAYFSINLKIKNIGNMKFNSKINKSNEDKDMVIREIKNITRNGEFINLFLIIIP